MIFKCRVKTYDSEEGEYCEYSPIDRDSAIGMVQQNWQCEERPNGLEIISISNSRGQHLLLEHFNKHVFDVYYLPLDKAFHFHKKSTVEIVLNAIDLFFSDRINDLESSLNKTKVENKYIRGDFFFVDHHYRFATKRLLNLSIVNATVVFVICMMYCLLGVFIALSNGAPIRIFGIVISAIGLLPPLAMVRLFYQYKNDIGQWSVRVTSREDMILATSPLGRKEFYKQDLVRVTKFENSDYRSLWNEYGYIQMEFKSGEVINLNSLMVEQLFVEYKFKGILAPVMKQRVWIPWIKKKTQIDLAKIKEI